MSLRAIAVRVLRAVRVRRRLDPQAYWIDRHEALGGGFESSGHIGLTEAENTANYDDKRARLREFLMAVVPADRPRSLLDAGCGTGLMIPVYQELGFTITGIDFAFPAGTHAPNLDDVTLIDGDISKLAVNPGSFDVICCIDVLFHVLDDGKWRDFFINSAKALKPGGMLVLQVHLRDDADYVGVEAHCHFRRYRDYAAIADESGFDWVRHERYALPVERVYKDLIALRRSSNAAAGPI